MCVQDGQQAACSLQRSAAACPMRSASLRAETVNTAGQRWLGEPFAGNSRATRPSPSRVGIAALNTPGTVHDLPGYDASSSRSDGGFRERLCAFSPCAATNQQIPDRIVGVLCE